jgi:hypothetical protein
LWFGFLLLWTIAAIASMLRGEGPQPAILLLPLLLGVLGFFIMKSLVLDLVDSVWDAGTELVVRDKGLEEKIPLRNISNIGHANFSNPPRITVSLREPSRFGTEFTFSPPLNFVFWKTHPLAQELIRRVDEARGSN